jgi:hypothetical protein
MRSHLLCVLSGPLLPPDRMACGNRIVAKYGKTRWSYNEEMHAFFAVSPRISHSKIYCPKERFVPVDWR